MVSQSALAGRLAQLRQRPQPSALGVVRASPTDVDEAWLFIDELDRPGLLARERSSAGHQRIAMRFAEIVVTRGVRCTLSTDSGDIEVVAALLQCDSDDPDVHDLFLRLLVIVLESLQRDRSPAGIEESIRGLRQMLATANETPRDLIGLWAELHMIAEANDAARLVRAWHTRARDPFDFLEELNAIEVKATQALTRQHHFRSHQLTSPPDTLVVSYLLTPSDAGPSVLDLLEAASIRVGGADRQKLEQTVLSAVHERVGEAQRVRFDRDLAEANRLAFRASELPAVRPPFPPGVSMVEFDLDLTQAQPEDPARYAGNDLWRAGLPAPDLS